MRPAKAVEAMSDTDNLLLSVNAEPRSVIYAWCLDTSFRSSREIVTDLLALTPQVPFAEPKRVVNDNLETLMENGLVQKRTLHGLQRVPNVTYALTDMGARMQAAPAYAIKFSVENEVPMVAVLGITRGLRNKTAPTRYRILTGLSNEPKSAAWLASEVGIPANHLPDHLRKLSALGLVEYRAFPEGTLPETRLRLTPGVLPTAVPQCPGRGIGTMAIAQALYDGGMLTYSEIAARTGYSKDSVKQVVTFLTPRGFVISDFDPANRSKIRLTGRGHRVAEGLRRIAQAASGERMAHELAPLDIPSVRAAYASAAFRLYAQHRGLAK